MNFIHVFVRNESKIITITFTNDDCLTFPGIPIGVVPRLVIRNSELACEMKYNIGISHFSVGNV